jgi:hypothetical protein
MSQSPAISLDALFGVTTVKSSTVEIPADLRATFAKAVIAFASVPNTTYVPQNMGTTVAADLYERQIRQYAKENNRSCVVKRSGANNAMVTWRFSKITPSVRGVKRTRKTNAA